MFWIFFLLCLWSDQSKFVAVLLFLDAFTKLQKATISFVMFARLSIRLRGTPLLPLDRFS